ncbi:hypothetical protein CVV38_00775 [Candidatus Peregrinibacteria bacterium HGW-Peregrinibacteria-1]|jgi:hypothetical protein|nr:MAG: hypothetical protein CVV38_00775 [Candidatus Peregrinibacteria bacterium HGW-Peregrinibacteria-1]
MKNYFRLTAFILVTGLLGGCNWGGKNDANLLETALPVTTDIVFAINHENGLQLRQWNRLKDEFPHRKELGDMLEKFFDEELAEEGEENPLTWKADIEPIVAGDWRLVVGYDFDENMNFDDLVEANQDLDGQEFGDDFEFEGFDMYLLFQTDKANQFEKLIADSLSDAELVESNSVNKKWSLSSGGEYLVRIGDQFLFVVGEEAMVDDAVERLLAGGDVNLGDGMEVPKGNLGYVLVNGKQLALLTQSLYGGEMGETIKDLEASYGYLEMKAEKDGLLFEGNMVVGNPSLYNLDYARNLVGKVVGVGTIFYGESGGVDLDVFIEQFVVGLASGGVDFDRESLQELVLDETGMTFEDFDALFKSPMAFSVVDFGGMVPGMLAYWDLSASDEAKMAGGKLAKYLDAQFEVVLPELQNMMIETPVGDISGALKKEMVVIEDGEVNRIYFDFSALTAEQLEMIKGLVPVDLSMFAFELYYGVSGDDVLIVGLGRDLEVNYGKKAVGDEAKYKGLMSQLGASYRGVSYFDFEPIFGMGDRYMAMADMFGVLTVEFKENYQKVKEFVTTIKYVGGGSVIEGNVVKSRGFVKIGK